MKFPRATRLFFLISLYKKRGTMKITFKERPIHEAPLAVLKHLYYYTTQYGLSVKQFTGAHWHYWEKLPERLRKAQNNPKKIESLIVELEDLASGSGQRLQKRREQIKGCREEEEGKWAEKEIILNAQLLSVLGALPEELLAVGFKKVTGCENLPHRLQIKDLVIKKDKKGEYTDFVEPDLLLLGDRHLLMVEVKTRGGEQSSRCYPPSQLLNYLHLVAKCNESDGDGLPNEFTHLILVPSTELRWLENYSKWVLDASDNRGRLKIDPESCIRLSKRKKSYDYKILRKLIETVPIYYRSWEELFKGLEVATQEYDDQRNRQHWQKVIDEVRELAKRATKYK